jgi:hypothetical protein
VRKTQGAAITAPLTILSEKQRMAPRNRERNGNGGNANPRSRGFRLVDPGAATGDETSGIPGFPALDEAASPLPQGADTRDDARQVARKAVWQNSRKLVTDLVETSGGNYLAVRFLFDFAGLMPVEQEAQESKADFKAFMHDLLNRPKTGLGKQTSAGKLNLSTGDSTQNS